MHAGYLRFNLFWQISIMDVDKLWNGQWPQIHWWKICSMLLIPTYSGVALDTSYWCETFENFDNWIKICSLKQLFLYQNFNSKALHTLLDKISSIPSVTRTSSFWSSLSSCANFLQLLRGSSIPGRLLERHHYTSPFLCSGSKCSTSSNH